jgi:hypothetical protein
MAHFARLDENNVVIDVIVVNNGIMNDLPFPESEPLGVAFCKSLYKTEETYWKQTSYNNNFRNIFAGIGGQYLPQYDVFIPPKPPLNPSFVLDETIFIWVPPVPMPVDIACRWNESTLSWDTTPKPFPSWTLQVYPLYAKWVSPVPPPPDMVPFGNKNYYWDEDKQEWIYIPPAPEEG